MADKSHLRKEKQMAQCGVQECAVTGHTASSQDVERWMLVLSSQSPFDSFQAHESLLPTFEEDFLTSVILT